ncbi:amino acid permease/ SLC12A domain-containing protein [Aspergillus ambiguus]|uniref:putative amino acid permease n=1 Tax=Aspergillus ambiguus TaxID=176160 RepID=UPI003CCD90A2
MIGAGNALAKAGPASILITYTVVGILVYQVLCALGEVASSLPEPCCAAGHATRYYDPALGFTLGWIYWLKYLVVVPSQLTAGTLVIAYWLEASPATTMILMTVFLLVITAANYWASRFLGGYEFFLSTFKILVVLGLIILSLVLALGGGPDRDVKGFKYWIDPGAFAGDTTAFGRLRAICRTIPSAMFAYLGSELIGINILHTRNPRRAAVHAIKLTFYRILAFNIAAVTLLGMLVPFDTISIDIPGNDPNRVPASAFVLAIQIAKLPVLPHLLNACLLLFVISSANFALCMASRTLYRLALEKNAPSFLSTTDKRGVPTHALGLCAVLASWGYLSVSSDSKVLFDYFVNLVTMFGLLTWMSILIIHVAFVRARRVQKIPDRAVVFRSPFGPFGSWVALAFCVIIAVVRTFDIVDQDGYPGRFNHWAFITSYLGIPLYLAIILGYKVATRCKHIRPDEVDLQNLKGGDERSRDREEEHPTLRTEQAKTWRSRIRAWLSADDAKC